MPARIATVAIVGVARVRARQRNVVLECMGPRRVALELRRSKLMRRPQRNLQRRVVANHEEDAIGKFLSIARTRLRRQRRERREDKDEFLHKNLIGVLDRNLEKMFKTNCCVHATRKNLREDRTLARQEVPIRTTAEFRVHGLDCAEEILVIRKQLSRAQGIHELNFDVVRGKMAVTFDTERVGPEQIQKVQALN